LIATATSRNLANSPNIIVAVTTSITGGHTRRAGGQALPTTNGIDTEIIAGRGVAIFVTARNVAAGVATTLEPG